MESGFERWPPTDGERLIALDDEVGFKGNRALDELVVARVGADDLELWYLGREEDLNPPIEQRRGFLELRLSGKPEPASGHLGIPTTALAFPGKSITANEGGAKSDRRFAQKDFPAVDDQNGLAQNDQVDVQTRFERALITAHSPPKRTRVPQAGQLNRSVFPYSSKCSHSYLTRSMSFLKRSSPRTFSRKESC